MTQLINNSQFWINLLIFFGSISFILFLLPIPVLRFTLDRRIRKALPKNWVYDAYTDWYGGIQRSMLFGMMCVFPHMNNAPMYRQLYNDFDDAAFANRVEKALSYCMAVNLFVFMLCAVIIVMLDFFGIIII